MASGGRYAFGVSTEGLSRDELRGAVEGGKTGGVAVAKEALVCFLRGNGVDMEAVERIHTLGMTFLESAIAAGVELQNQILRVIQDAPFPQLLADSLVERLTPWIDKDVAVRSS